MLNQFSQLFIIIFISFSCQTGNLKLIADLPNSLDEISAAEMLAGSTLLWVIEDAGNKNILYGLNNEGKILREIRITNVKNDDWEDLTADNAGNIYIGDFGNNSKKRKEFSILKVKIPPVDQTEVSAEIIQFELAKKVKSQDFEGFFIYDSNFYIFSKERKETKLFKVPNITGKHEAKLISTTELKGKNTEITSADIRADGKVVLLLNHDKLYRLTGFKKDDFFSGSFEAMEFGHKSQKEGLCFKSDSSVYLTDERKGNNYGNLYEFDLQGLKVKSKSK